jgi:integrase
MSKPKGNYLYWRKESRKPDGTIRNKAGYIGIVGGRQVSLGSGITDVQEAQEKFDAYIASIRKAPRQRDRDPAEVKIVDVLAYYGEQVVPNMQRAKATAGRLEKLAVYFGGDMTVDQIDGQACREFSASTGTKTGGRDYLEDLRAALNFYKDESKITSVPTIILPEKSSPRERWLTREEGAALLRAAWRMKQSWKGQDSDRRTGRHLARYLLVAYYTGTRTAAICGAALRPTVGRPWIDLDKGVYYRKAQGAKKTSKRQPPVRLPDALMAHIRRWAEKGIAKDFVVEWNGKPVKSIRKSFRSACDQAGLGGDVIPHTLRHSAATWMMEAEVDPWKAAGYLGMTVDVLIEVYGHHNPALQNETANAASKNRRAKQLQKRTENNVIDINTRRAS